MVAILFGCRVATAQDILSLLLSGDARSRSIGGNPFSSLDEGNLLSSESTGYVHSSLRFDFKDDDIYREACSDGTETLLQNINRQTDLSLALSDEPMGPRLGISVKSSGSSAIMDQSPSEHANYEAEHRTVMLSYETPLGSLMRVGVAVGRSYRSPQKYAAYESRFSFLLPAGILLNLKMGSWEHSQALQLQISGTDGLLPLDYAQRGADFTLRVPVGALSVLATGHEDFISSAANSSRAFDTRFTPDGVDYGYGLHCLATIGNGWKGLLSLTRAVVEGNGIFCSSDQTYGKLDEFGFENTVAQGAVQSVGSSGGLIEADVKWQSIRGNVEGYAEDWPFVSIFDSPIPVRENVQASGGIDIMQMHVGGETSVSRLLRCAFGASILRARPDFKLESWESKYIVFGVRGYKERGISVNLIDAAILSAGVQMKLWPFIVGYSFTQFVPIYIGRSSSTGEGSVSSSLSGQGHASGGQFHRLTIEYEF